MTEIKVNDRVEYTEPMEDEIGMTYRVLEVNGDRVIMEAEIDFTVNPTYIAQVEDLKVI